MMTTNTTSLIDQFHTLYYDRREQTWGNTFWLGHHVLKCPLDLWSYQEILHEVRPALIIETGTYLGGSAFFLASICDLLGSGEVVTIDSERQANLPRHPRVTYLNGSSTSRGILREVRQRVAGRTPVLVILDSGHGRDHVLAELEVYAPLVTPGSYLIVEDTNLNGHPVEGQHGPGPAEAVSEFLSRNPAFARDESREKLMLTFNPGGYLRKVSATANGDAGSRSWRGGLWQRLGVGRQGHR
jgi:cephalosporin hydroxylase